MKPYRTGFLALVPLLFIVLCHRPSPPLVHAGQVDLSNEQYPLRNIPLNGVWQFHPSDFSNPGQDLPFRIQVPGSWNSAMPSGSGLGFGSYRAMARLPQPGVYGISMPIFGTAYELYINGIPIASNGLVGDSREMMIPQQRPLLAVFQTNTKDIEIVIHVSNYFHRSGGIRSPIIVGDVQSLLHAKENRLAQDLFLFGSFVFMALYQFGLFFLNRRDLSHFSFGLFCILISIRTLVTREIYLATLFPGIPWELQLALEYMSLYAAVPIFLLFLYSLYPKDFHRPVLLITTLVSIVLTLFVIFTDTYVYTHTLVAYQFGLFLVSLYCLIILTIALLRKRDFALYVLSGTAILLGFITASVLNYWNVLRIGEVFPLGLFFFLFFHSFMLSSRFSKALRGFEDLSRRLLSLDRIKDDFLIKTSLELKTPLHGIIGIAESLLSAKSTTMSISPSAKRHVAHIVQTGHKLIGLVNNILDFSKLKHKTLTLSIRPAYLKSHTDVALSLLEKEVDGKPIIFENQVPPDFPAVLADEDRLTQILTNLIGNSIKFTDRGTIKISAKIKEKMAEVVVEDTGIGIPQREIDRVFQPFEQVDGSLERIQSGTGLGLSITRSLVELHNGIIKVQSEPYKGSRFMFTIPLAPAMTKATALTLPDSSTLSIHQQETDVGFSIAADRILVVDDEANYRSTLYNILRLNGYDVAQASSGDEAWQILEKRTFDLVVLDVLMPKVSGFETARKIREKFKLQELPILLLTMKGRTEELLRNFDAANDFIAKPFEQNELLARVRTLIGLRKAADESRRLTALDAELELARQIQQSLLPAQLPNLPWTDVHVEMMPVSAVGGDIFDFKIENGGSGLGVFLADGTGHGIPGAMLASMIKAAYYLSHSLVKQPAELLHNLNEALYQSQGKHLATAAYVFIDQAKKKLYYANAGHHPLFLLRNGEALVVKSKGILLGFQKNSTYETTVIDLLSNDRLLLFTDGILDLSESRSVTEDDIIKLLKESAGLKVKDASSLFIPKDSIEDDAVVILLDLNDSF